MGGGLAEPNAAPGRGRIPVLRGIMFDPRSRRVSRVVRRNDRGRCPVLASGLLSAVARERRPPSSRSGSSPMVRTTRFIALAALGVVSRFAPVTAQDNLKNDPSKQGKPAGALQVGDPAPALKVTRWLQGDAVRK